MGTVLADSRVMIERFRKLDQAAQDRVKAVVASSTKNLLGDAQELVGKPVTVSKRGRLTRSRPGQPPRRQSGRFLHSLKWKTSPKGWVGYVTTTNLATDKHGRRYPWMLESGTKFIRKRPVFKRLQRQFVKRYRRDVGRAMIEAVQASR